jgi:uncharacterized protein YjbJ (UPF0337 family)
MNKDQAKGRVKEVDGNVKEFIGKMTNDRGLEQKGKIEKVGGKVQARYGDLKRDIKKNGQSE